MRKSKFCVVGIGGLLGKYIFANLPPEAEKIGVSSRPGACYSCDLKSKTVQVPPLTAGDLVIFTAAVSSPDQCEDWSGDAYLINVVGTISFLEKAIRAGAKVIFFSSDTVYGEQAENFDESRLAAPLGGYAKMKKAVEDHFLGHKLFKSVRLSYVFSRDDKFTRYLLSCQETGQEAEIFDPLVRSVIYIKDVNDAVLGLARQWDRIKPQSINFGGPENVKREEFCQNIIRYKTSSVRYRVVQPSPGFFEKRPKIIAMRSPHLSALLEREPFKLSEACKTEFRAPAPSEK